MKYHFTQDESCPQPTKEEEAQWNAAKLVLVLLILVACVTSCVFQQAGAAERGTSYGGADYTLLRSGQLIKWSTPLTTESECDEAVKAQRLIDAATKTSGSHRYICREDRWTNVSYGPNPVMCPAAPAPRTGLACPSGMTGTWTQTAAVGAAPACVVTWTPSAAPANACTPIPVEPTGTATLTWIHDGQNISGFRVIYGTSPTALTRSAQATGSGTRTYRVEGLAPAIYHFAVVAMGVCTNPNTPLASCAPDSTQSNVASKVVL